MGVNQHETLGVILKAKAHNNLVAKLDFESSPNSPPERPERKPVALLVTVKHGELSYESVVFNLSVQGCNIITDDMATDFSVGDSVGLDFSEYGEVGAVLRWVQPQEAGLEFIVKDSEAERFSAWLAVQLLVDCSLPVRAK